MLGFGVIGTNTISEWFAAACARTGVARAVAVCSREQDRADAFAAAHGLPLAFDDLDRMLDAPQVQAVYVASPMSEHHRQALAALERGRHVLCEKTLAADAGQAEELFEAARRRGVLLLEAVRPLHDPALAVVREQLPRLGTVRGVHFTKLQYSSRYDRFRAGEVPNAFDPALGTSALADIGVYCLQPALDLFGAPSSDAGASVVLRNGFEGAGVLVLTYPGFTATCAYSKISREVGPSAIHGEDADLVIDSTAEPALIELVRPGGAREVVFERPGGCQPWENMHHEIETFAAWVAAGRGDDRYERITLQSRAIMDRQLARAARR